jgi:choice-of-anchor B domain-containing protein
MKKILFTLLVACVGTAGFSQLNVELLDQMDYTQNISDVWGWFDPVDSTEYALVGTATGVSVVSLEDPQNIVEVALATGASSSWRDIKTWGNYAYVTNESSGGLMVIDLSGAPDNITWTNWAPDIPGLGTLSSIHNIFIDEFGIAYLAGSNLNSGGVLFVDVATTPGSPSFIAAAPPAYNHDTYARDNIMYSSEIYAGELGIYDVSDKMNVVKLAAQQTPAAFTHNAWLNDAGDVVFTTDEKANAPVTAYDISELDNIVELDQFVPIATMGNNVIPHNVHVWEDWLIVSYYTDGGIIVDASNPSNLIEVGNWDTFLGGNGGFSGVWGAYPYLPSGLILLADIGNGLYVCGPTYVRACWLEGTVTSSATGLPIFGAEVYIQSTQANLASTGSDGTYQTGQAIPGTFDVVFSATGYTSKTVPATLENGVLTILDVQLDPIFSFSITGQTVKTIDGTPVAGAQVVLSGDGGEFSATTDGNGIFNFQGVFSGVYTLYAGAWGYLHEAIENFTVNINTPQPVIITLDKGYQDDFILDLGWTETHTASTGWWVRGEPIGTDYDGAFSNTDFDVDGDLGDQCFVTGNGGGGAGNDDVDNGVVTLFSPIMDLSNYNEPKLRYYTWFFNEGGNGDPNDTLKVRITNGTDEVELETIAQSNSAWNPASEFDLAGLITLTDNMQVIFETSDLAGSGHLVEAAVDAFRVEDTSLYPAFQASATEGCQPLIVNFTDPSDSTATWAWTFEGGTPATSNVQNPSVTFGAPGTYTVNLTVVTNDGNTYTIDRPNFITVNVAPVAGFDNNVSGATVNFTNTSTGGGTYQWDFGDGSGTSTEHNPAYTYDATGQYTVTLTATNDCGSSTTSIVVQVLAVSPTALFSVDATTGCVPFEVQFTDLSEGTPNTWAWSFPGGTPATSNEQNPAVTYNEAGTYSVQLSASNAAGTSEVIQSQFIEVADVPSVGFTFDVNGGEVTFTNTSQDATSYVWDFGDNSMSTEANPVYTYGGSDSYEVTLEAANDCGFNASTQTVTIQLTGTFDLDESAYVLAAAPNPFEAEVLVNYELRDNFSDARLLVFNVLDEQIASHELDSANGTVALGREIKQSGIYFVRLVIDGSVGKALRVVKI